MKLFSIYDKSSFLNDRPQEDYFVISKKYPIFVVADGVSLDFYDKYPNQSGAGEVAKIFCDIIVSEAEKLYDNFKEKNLEKIFEIGNEAISRYNIANGRTKKTINYYDIDLFSTTTSFALVKDSKLYWWSLCDSGVKLFNAKGKNTFSSPNGWISFPKNWDEKVGGKEKIISRHRDYRNIIDKNGKLVGYGVANGEKNAQLYLNRGVVDISNNNLLFLYTDGFENYFGQKEFINIFKLWSDDIENRLNLIISEKSKEDYKKYGREKTLIAVSF